jgi:hypothetical protein
MPIKYSEKLDISAETMPTHRLIFTAVISQCEWCKERWPLAYRLKDKSFVHVGPFTQDDTLFSWPCAASSLRLGMDYRAYAGGPKHEWKLPTIAKLLASKTVGSKTSPDNRSFWRTGCRATIEVNGWPDWMRNTSISGRPSGNRMRENASARRDLLIFDALDAHARKPCTDNYRFTPDWSRGNMKTPTCNGGIGCTGCWAVYERAYERAHDKWEREHPCNF